ncbi:MAG: hypothetical protein J6T37_06935, partial [Bacteroidales bacterium]|nr:hypothetical protein [Bacteroidales bacterium]
HWNFRFLTFQTTFYWLIAFKELATFISVDCGCKSTPIFITRNTFLKKIFNYFLCTDYQSVGEGNFLDWAEKRLEVLPFKGLFNAFSPKNLRHTYAKSLKSN